MLKKILAVCSALLLLAACGPAEAPPTEENEPPAMSPFYEAVASNQGETMGVVMGLPVLADEIGGDGVAYLHETCFPGLEEKAIEEALLTVDLGGCEPYLIIPRTSDALVTVTELILDESGETVPTENTVNHNGIVLVYCNPSDLWSNAQITVVLSPEETTEFSPYLSLKDGALEAGSHMETISLSPVFTESELASEEAMG